MRTILWTNDVDAEFDAIAKCPYEYGIDDDDDDSMWQMAYENIETALNKQIKELDITAPGEIVLVGTLQRWDGAHEAYASLKTDNIGEALRIAQTKFGGDNIFQIYTESDALYISQTGHDNPVNPSVMEFRALTDNDAAWNSNEELRKCSVSLHIA